MADNLDSSGTPAHRARRAHPAQANLHPGSESEPRGAEEAQRPRRRQEENILSILSGEKIFPGGHENPSFLSVSRLK